MNLATRFAIAASLLGLFAPPGLSRTLDVHVMNGPGTGNQVHIRVVDITGIVHVSKTIRVCSAYSFTVPDDRKFFIHIVDYRTWLPLYFGWERGPGDIDFEEPLPPANGFCGDGNISGAEACDTKNNAGCDPTSSAPVCLSGCLSCGCGCDAHCPQPSPSTGPCGYGTCASTERPHWRGVCSWGACISTYRCVADPDCIAKECEAQEESQQVCSDGCTGTDQLCYYGQATGCWYCMTPEEVTDPCASPAQPDCLLDPRLLGIACNEESAGDTVAMLDEFAIDGITEDEAILVATGQGEFLGLVHLRFADPHRLEWQDDPAFDFWHAYRGSMDVLVSNGDYSQLPGSNPWALKYCYLPEAWIFDVEEPVEPYEVVYYLVTTLSEGDESALGPAPDGNERPHGFPCP
jgi:hypothetical protein